MFPTFVALAAHYRGQPVHIAAFALDNYPEDVADFFGRVRRTVRLVIHP